MKLTTYFRAMEKASEEIMFFADTHTNLELDRLTQKYDNLRSGLIRRMERVEFERDNLKEDKKLLRQWLEEAEAKE